MCRISGTSGLLQHRKT